MTGPAVRWPASDKQKYIERKIVLYAYDTSHAVSVAPITCIVLNIHHLVVPVSYTHLTLPTILRV